MTTTVSTTTLPNDDINENDADKNILTLTHEESSCRIHLFGATVLSFNDHLFCSKHAHFDGSKPIRGGIPIVFPIFGPPSQKSTMPQHGFARCNYWTVTDVIQEEHACVARLSLALTDVVHGRGANNPWSIEQAALDQTDCRLEYKVRLEKQRLTCALTVLNTGASSFAFNSLLHTYLHVPARNTTVRGLGGYSKLNQLSREADAVTQPYDEPIAVLPEMDAVYTHPDHHPTAHIYVGEHLEIEAAGQVNEAVAGVNVVVWNPGAEKAAAMSDFGNDEYEQMMCVEPGLLGHQPLLPPGAEATLTQSLSVKK